MKRTSLAPANWLRAACRLSAVAIVVVGVGCKSAGSPNAGMPGLTQAPVAETPKKSYNPLTWFKKSGGSNTPDPGFTMNTALPDPTADQKLDVQIAMAQQAEAEGKVQEALDVYKDALSQAPTRADLYVRMAVCHDRLGEFAESKQLYQTALKNSPGNPDIFCDIGYSQYLQRNWADSERAYRQALAINPKHVRTHNNLGLLLARTERVDEALMAFQKGGCSEGDARSNVALAMSLEGDLEGARDQYLLAMKAEPNSASAREGLELTEKLIAKATGKPGSVSATMTAQRAKPMAMTPIVAKPQDRQDPLLASVAAVAPAPVVKTPPTAPAPSASQAAAPAKPKAPAANASTSTASAAARPASSTAQTATVMRIPAVDDGKQSPVVQTSQIYPSTSSKTPAQSPVVQAKDEVELDFVEGSLQRDRYANEVQ